MQFLQSWGEFMATTINTPSATKTLSLSGIAAALITTFTHTATGSDHVAQWIMGIGGIVLYAVDHLKTIVAAYKKGA